MSKRDLQRVEVC